jgi:hypothetical protein
LGKCEKACDGLNENGCSDWSLPIKDELNKLYHAKSAVGGFSVSHYWSSTEVDAYSAWYQSFNIDIQDFYSKKNSNRVRAVRFF